MKNFFTYLHESGIDIENCVIINETKEILRLRVKFNELDTTVFFTLYRDDISNEVEKIYVYDGLKGAYVTSNEELAKFVKSL